MRGVVRGPGRPGRRREDPRVRSQRGRADHRPSLLVSGRIRASSVTSRLPGAGRARRSWRRRCSPAEPNARSRWERFGLDALDRRKVGGHSNVGTRAASDTAHHARSRARRVRSTTAGPRSVPATGRRGSTIGRSWGFAREPGGLADGERVWIVRRKPASFDPARQRPAQTVAELADATHRLSAEASVVRESRIQMGSPGRRANPQRDIEAMVGLLMVPGRRLDRVRAAPSVRRFTT
jgi:hypothetical protein